MSKNIEIFNELYPIGSIFMSLDIKDNPEKIYGKWKYLGIEMGAHCWVRVEKGDDEK